ncbi:hypothetical protein [Bacterioplanoides sp. SCSIO 12839]|uniref:hypothetical protein n=1 Tax=Bacterioplanoides sp. SCSIO 12839 TaxID=2829569 RepID=UPI002106F844|nr:hypothetical protein [Bacterioplanoides sp. SCSIO 12839]UTW47187.1 hypothetical protein KFF03_11390 [Bacterioplanoides sp. SCSIO 12839]
MNKKCVLMSLLLFYVLSIESVYADLTPMAEQELDAMYGQAIFEVRDQVVAQSNGTDLSMLRLTVGAQVEINANVAEVSLGRYWRPEGTNCTGGNGDRVCYNNNPPASYNDNIDWACTAAPCGSVGLDDAQYVSSAITHGEERAFSEYPSGFFPDAGIDVKIRDLTMGQVNCNGGTCTMTPLVQQNPYLEFAFDETSGSRKLVGFRVGAEDGFGYQGNAIDVISGFIRPAITADAGFLGIINLETQLGGVRTVGWIDQNQTIVTGGSGLASILGAGAVEGISPTAQLFPVQSNYLDHTAAFFFSMGTRAIDWSEVAGYSPETTRPGVWINLGGDGGLVANTRQGDHPINYFPGHPNYDRYNSGTNYTRPQASWSETYQ